MSFFPSLNERGPKQTIKIIIGVLLCSQPFVKFMKWCSSTGWKNTQLRKAYSLTCSLALRRVGCTEASFTILKQINERGSKVFGCFLDVRKAIDKVWIYGLPHKLFSEFGIRGRMWLAIKHLYTGVKVQVLYSDSLSRKSDVSQGTGQGRILAPFIYKVYINSLLVKLTQHSFAISINMLSIPFRSFSDDISLLSTYPIFLSTFMNLCYEYSVK